jgi:hypothetical protein
MAAISPSSAVAKGGVAVVLCVTPDNWNRFAAGRFAAMESLPPEVDAK